MSQALAGAVALLCVYALWSIRRHRRIEGALRARLDRCTREARYARLREEITSALAGSASVEVSIGPVMRAIRREAGAHRVAVVSGDRIWCTRLSREENEIHRSKLRAGLSMERVASDVVSDERYREVWELSFDARPIAALAVGGSTPFDVDIVRRAVRPLLASLLAGVLAAAAERRHEALQTALARLARAAVGVLDARAMLNCVLSLIREELGVERCLVRLPTADGKLAIFEESLALGTAPLRGSHLFDELPGIAPRVGEIAIVRDVFEGTPASWVTSDLRARLAAAGVRSWMAVAIPIPDAGCGMLTVHQTSRQRNFTPEEGSFLEHASSHVAAAMEACRRYDREVETSRMKSDFLANTSHELRTPLHAILGHAELLSRLPLDDRNRQRLESIREAGAHLLTLVNNLIDLSRLQTRSVTLTRQTVDLREIVAAAASVARGAVKDRPIEIRTSWRDDSSTVIETDPTRVRQILVNLAGNAAKFTDRGEIVLAIERFGDAIELSVRDTGRGIEPRDVETIFEKFNQVGGPSEAKGAGLGLAISRELANLLGGSLRVESDVGRGARFTLSLPFTRVEAHAVGIAS